jgi:hypothetical protein
VKLEHSAPTDSRTRCFQGSTILPAGGSIDISFSVVSCGNVIALCGIVACTLPRVEAGSNTSTVALRVVGGDEKGTQCLGGIIGSLCSWGI